MMLDPAAVPRVQGVGKERRFPASLPNPESLPSGSSIKTRSVSKGVSALAEAISALSCYGKEGEKGDFPWFWLGQHRILRFFHVQHNKLMSEVEGTEAVSVWALDTGVTDVVMGPCIL